MNIGRIIMTIAIASYLVPLMILVGVVIRNEYKQINSYFLTWFIFASIVQVIMSVLAKFFINNLFMSHIYVVITFILITQYARQVSQIYKKTFLIAGSLVISYLIYSQLINTDYKIIEGSSYIFAYLILFAFVTPILAFELISKPKSIDHYFILALVIYFGMSAVAFYSGTFILWEFVTLISNIIIALGFKNVG